MYNMSKYSSKTTTKNSSKSEKKNLTIIGKMDVVFGPTAHFLTILYITHLMGIKDLTKTNIFLLFSELDFVDLYEM